MLVQMNVENVNVKASTWVTVLRLVGSLDGSNFESLILKARDLHASGMRNMLLDLAGLDFMSSAGMVALHSLVLMMRGEQLPDLTEGWEALRGIGRDEDSAGQKNIKLLNPQPRVLNTLQISGMDRFFEIFTSEREALESF